MKSQHTRYVRQNVIWEWRFLYISEQNIHFSNELRIKLKIFFLFSILDNFGCNMWFRKRQCKIFGIKDDPQRSTFNWNDEKVLFGVGHQGHKGKYQKTSKIYNFVVSFECEFYDFMNYTLF